MKYLKYAMAALAAAFATAAAPAADSGKDPVPIALPAPPPGKGQIVFFRGGGGFAVACSVHENGKKVSSLGAGRYFIMVADPGRHEFSVKSEAKDTLALEVEADETQFVNCKIKMGILIGRPDIRPSTEADFRKGKNLKMVDEDDMGPGEGALRPGQVAAALGTTSTPAQP